MRKFILLILLISLCVCGCGNNNTEGKNDTKDFANNSQQIILAAYRHLAPGEQDAFYCSKILGVWEPLITMDTDGRPKGCLATGWKMLNGGREWIFYLRQGVTFHNGLWQIQLAAFQAECRVSHNKDFTRKTKILRIIRYKRKMKTFILFNHQCIHDFYHLLYKS